jgi:hypothetical protein
MHHNGDDAGATDRALREFERRPKIAASNAWGSLGCISRGTTTVSAVLRAELHLAAIVVCQLLFGPLLLSTYSISLDLSKRGHPAGSTSLEMALSARVSL